MKSAANRVIRQGFRHLNRMDKRANPKGSREDTERARKAILAGLVPVAAGFVTVTLAGQFSAGERAIASVAAALDDPAALLASRSPGTRAPGALMSSKGPRKAVHHERPVAQEVPKEFTEQAAAPPEEQPEPVALLAQPMTPLDLPLPLEEAGLPQIGGGSPDYVPGFTPPPIVWGSGGGQPTPTPTPTPTPEPTPTPTPTPTIPLVPEPATWALAIGGFALVGATLRRRPRRTAGSAS